MNNNVERSIRITVNQFTSSHFNYTVTEIKMTQVIDSSHISDRELKHHLHNNCGIVTSCVTFDLRKSSIRNSLISHDSRLSVHGISGGLAQEVSFQSVPTGNLQHLLTIISSRYKSDPYFINFLHLIFSVSNS